MKTIITIFFLLLFAQMVLAIEGYHKGDTIWYKFDKMLIETASTRATRSQVPLKTHYDRLKQIQKILSEMHIEEPANDERVVISLHETDEYLYGRNYKELELRKVKREKKLLVVFKDGTTFEKDYGKYCIHFSFRAVESKLYLDDLNDISLIFQEEFKLKTDRARNLLLQKFGEKYRKGIQGWIDLRGDDPKGYFQQNRSTATQDMLYLSAGIGSGLVQNTFVTDINLRLGVSFGYKGIYKNAYYIDWNMMYDFSESNDNNFFELNHFVSLTWDHNFAKTTIQDKWYGFSVGYLVKRNNDFFKENTFRVAVNKKINDTFSVKPELYFNDFLKNVYPGIRVSVAF